VHQLVNKIFCVVHFTAQSVTQESATFAQSHSEKGFGIERSWRAEGNSAEFACKDCEKP
jgi:hypothetical protein